MDKHATEDLFEAIKGLTREVVAMRAAVADTPVLLAEAQPVAHSCPCQEMQRLILAELKAIRALLERVEALGLPVFLTT